MRSSRRVRHPLGREITSYRPQSRIPGTLRGRKYSRYAVDNRTGSIDHGLMASPPRMRPQFVIPVQGDGQVVLDRLKEKLEAPDAKFYGQVRGRYAFARLPEERRTLLSPHLNLELRDSETGTILHCRFSPRPNVWTGFMALFFFLGMAGLGGLIYGLAELMGDGPTWPIWLAPASLALIAFIYGAAFIGQGLSNDEMYELRALVERTVTEVGGVE